MIIDITETKTMQVTPKVLAQIFWEMDATAQSEFFSCVGELAGSQLDNQFHAIANLVEHDSQERDTLQVIGNNLKDAN